MIGVCLKWVDRRPEVDPLTGAVHAPTLARPALRRRPGGPRAGRCGWARRRGTDGRGHHRRPGGGRADAARRAGRRRGPRHPRRAGRRCAERTRRRRAGRRASRRGRRRGVRRRGAPIVEAVRCPPTSPPIAVRPRPSGSSRSTGTRRARSAPSDASTAAGANGCGCPAPAVVSVEGGTRLRRAAWTAVLAAADATISVVVPTAGRGAPASQAGAHRSVPSAGPCPAPPLRRRSAHAERILALAGAAGGPGAAAAAGAARPAGRRRRAPRATRARGATGEARRRGSWPEVAARAAASVLVVPLGSTEQHGPHLPLSTDTDIAVRARGAPGARPVPTSWWRPAAAVRLERRARRVRRHPLDRAGGARAGGGRARAVGRRRSPPCVLVSAHGGNAEPLVAGGGHAAVRRPAGAWRGRRPVFGGDAHAGRTETSLLLAIGPTPCASTAAGRRHPAAGRARATAAGRGRARGVDQRGARRPDGSVGGRRSALLDSVRGRPDGDGRRAVAVAERVPSSPVRRGASARPRPGGWRRRVVLVLVDRGADDPASRTRSAPETSSRR